MRAHPEAYAMPRKLKAGIAFAISSITIGSVLSSEAPSEPNRAVVEADASANLGSIAIPDRIELIAAEQPPADPCYDFHALHAGKGEPPRQEWFNSLRTDGQEPDYLRYWVACQPEGDGGRFWNPSYSLDQDRRWTTEEYICFRGLLDGEHGGQPWDIDHQNGEGPNLPQAKPVSKIAGLTIRDTVQWAVDYTNGKYGGPLSTPNPCDAGY